jgi:hypothetical protein
MLQRMYTSDPLQIVPAAYLSLFVKPMLDGNRFLLSKLQYHNFAILLKNNRGKILLPDFLLFDKASLVICLSKSFRSYIALISGKLRLLKIQIQSIIQPHDYHV